MKVIIIGSGLSGLTAGAYLISEGYDVIIYEQNDLIGGVTATIRKDGFSWDLGPLLLDGFAPYESAAKTMKELDIYDHVEFIRDDRGQSFPDFDIWKPEKYEGPLWRKSFFTRLFPEEKEGLNDYYKLYDKMMNILALGDKLDWAKGLKTFFLKIKLYLKLLTIFKKLKWSAQELMDYYFSNDKLKAVFTGILADFVVKPSEFPGLGVPTVNVESAFDIRIPLDIKEGKLPTYHYIKGGCQNLVDAFADKILSQGGKIETNKLVKKIIVENNIIKGVQLEDGEIISSDLVIASGGIQKVFYDQVGKDKLPQSLIEQIEKIVYMGSVLMVHIGIDFDPSSFQKKPLCYYYRTYDIETSIEECREGIYHEGKEGFLIYIPSFHTPEMAPEGKHAITIYTIAPYRLKDRNWDKRREELAEKLLIEAEKIIPNLRKGIETKIIMTPYDFEKRINVLRHSFGGTAPTMSQNNPSHRTPINGLWYIGAYSESGGGVAGVINGTRKAIKQLLENFQ
ncbi:MAG: NAD(P)-binding protein [Candidatus Lokiarchaeota archaeon]|nr:NAD(P)-binding protein [Candidatus Lokiarchaeota archaeon]MBD3202280.1 NAD(P)-binding protein [Candidatus Lokiarchaeota archaeon]